MRSCASLRLWWRKPLRVKVRVEISASTPYLATRLCLSTFLETVTGLVLHEVDSPGDTQARSRPQDNRSLPFSEWYPRDWSCTSPQCVMKAERFLACSIQLYSCKPHAPPIFPRRHAGRGYLGMRVVRSGYVIIVAGCGHVGEHI